MVEAEVLKKGDGTDWISPGQGRMGLTISGNVNVGLQTRLNGQKVLQVYDLDGNAITFSGPINCIVESSGDPGQEYRLISLEDGEGYMRLGYGSSER